MRRQDELKLLYPAQRPPARKYLLSQMEALALAFDSEELLELLRGELASPEPAVSAQALVSLTRFLPGFTGKRYGLAGQMRSDVSAYGMNLAKLKEAAARARESVEQAPMIGQAARMATAPMVEAMLKVAGRLSGWSRERVLIALGRYRLGAARRWLRESLSPEQPDLSVALALAEMDEQEATIELIGLVKTAGPRNPQLYLLLSACNEQRAFDLVMDAIPRTDSAGRMNLAGVLGWLPHSDVPAACLALRRHGEVWVDAMALASMERIGAAEFLPLAKQIYAEDRRRFIKIQAVKLAGGVRDRAAVDFCLEVLKNPDHAICAVAIESLVRLRAPPDQLRTAAAPFLTSPHLKARVNAMLATLTPEEAREHPAMQALILSTNALHRMEAAYCLGYLQSEKARDLLGTLASEDPEVDVRDQAIKGLSRYPVAIALDQLMPLLSAEDNHVVLTTARVITRFEGHEAQLACTAILEALKTQQKPFARALLYRALGQAAPIELLPTVRAALAKALAENDAKVLPGVLESLVVLGSGGDAELDRGLAALSAHEHPKLRARALLARWNSGFTDAPVELAKMIESGQDAKVDPGVECALEIGMLIARLAEGTRFAELSKALQGRAGTPEYTAFCGREEPVPMAEAPEAPTGRAAGEFDVKSSRLWAHELAPPSRKVATTETSDRAVRPRPSGAVPSVGKRPSGLNAVRRPSGRVQPVAAEGFGAARLREFLTTLLAPAKDAGREGLVAEVSRVTYLIEDDGPADGSRVRRWMRQAIAFARAHPALAAPPVAFLVMCALIARRMGEQEGPVAASGTVAFLVVSVAGSVKPPGNEPPLISGDILRVKESFTLDARAVATLSTPAGDRLQLTGPGTLSIEPLDAGKPQHISVECAELNYDPRAGGSLAVRLGRSELTSPGIPFGAARSAGGYAVEPRAAGVVAREGGTRIELAPRKKRELH